MEVMERLELSVDGLLNRCITDYATQPWQELRIMISHPLFWRQLYFLYTKLLYWYSMRELNPRLCLERATI